MQHMLSVNIYSIFCYNSVCKETHVYHFYNTFYWSKHNVIVYVMDVYVFINDPYLAYHNFVTYRDAFQVYWSATCIETDFSSRSDRLCRFAEVSALTLINIINY